MHSVRKKEKPIMLNGRQPRRFPLRPLLSAALAVVTVTAHATPPSVLTQHNDNARTGANLAETTLTPANVSAATFGKLFTRSLDANVNGQVLYVPNVTIQGVVHNVLYAYTSNNSNGSPCSLYAFDADDPNQSSPLWHTPLTASAQWTTCTPVIDPSTSTLYVLTKDNNDSGATNLRAFDITTGAEKTGSPITIQATVSGTGDGSVNGKVSFDTTHANCRPGLLLLNGIVYVAFAHNSDSFPYHGWVFGYSYDQTKFTQTAIFCTNPNGGLDGIWMAGKGLMADANNNIYCTVGNGTFDVNSGGTSYGMCVLKLSTPNLTVADWFAPFDEQPNSDADLDLGNCGVLGIPGTDRIFTGGTKFGSVFLLDSTNLGHFTSGGPDKVVQRFDSVTPNNDVGQNAVCWDASSAKYVYLWPGGTDLLQFKYDPAVSQFNPAGVYKQNSSFTSGGSLTVTSNGSSNGILWAVGNNHVFHAFNAADVTQELWNSNTNASRDALPSVGHFQFPTVVNGKVYVPTGSASIAVYGLLSSTTTTLNPTADAFVRAGTYANKNFGTSTRLASEKLTNDSKSIFNRASYLKFDLTGVHTAPTTATLKLTVTSASSPATASEDLQVYSVADTSWTETGITWNNAPGLNRTNFTSAGTLITAQTVSLSPGTVSIDLTSFVAAHLGQVVTLQLLDATNEGVYLVFNSREYRTNKPQLVLTQ